MFHLTSKRRPLKAMATGLSMVILLLVGLAGPVAAQDKAAAEKYNEGLAQLKEKNFESALSTFLDAKKLAEESGDSGTSSKAHNYAYRLCYNVGVGYVKGGNTEKALEYFDQGIALAPTYYKNHKGKAAVLKSQGNVAEAMQAYIKTAELASDAGELEERSKARAQAEGFVAKALQGEDFQGVVDNGTMFLSFTETVNVHFYMAHAYNQLGQHQSAVEHADKALALDKGSRAAKAKLHFEKAEALKYLAQYSAAVSSYTEAAYGEFKQRAEHEIEVLSGSY